MAKRPDDQYSEHEARERFMRSLKAAVNTAPKPLKDKPKSVAESHAKKSKKKRT